MKYNHILVLLLALVLSDLSAQNSLKWSKPYNTSEYTHFFNDQDGNLYSAFSITIPGANLRKGCKLVKSSPQGNVLWTVNLEDYFDAQAMVVDVNKNIYLGGKQTSGAGTAAIVYKVESNGNLAWSYKPANSSISSITSLQADPKGKGVYMIAYDAGLTAWNPAILTFGKIDEDGGVSWQQNYSGPAGINQRVNGNFHSIRLDGDSNLYVASTIDFSQPPSETTGIYCAKFSSTGTKLWEQVVGSAQVARKARSFIHDNENNLIFYSDSSALLGRITKVTKDGALAWEKTIETASAGNLFKTDNGTYVITSGALNTYIIHEISSSGSFTQRTTLQSQVAGLSYSGLDQAVTKQGYSFLKFNLSNLNGALKQSDIVGLDLELQRSWSTGVEYGGTLTKGIMAIKDSNTFYFAKDSSLTGFSVIEKYMNFDDTIPPLIALLGNNPFNLTQGDDYEEPGFTVTDNYYSAAELMDFVTITSDLGVRNDTLWGETEGVKYIRYQVTDPSGNTSQPVQRQVIVSKSSGLKKYTGDNAASIYPNPASGLVTLSFGEPLQQQASLVIYDMAGAKMKEQNLESNAADHPIATSGLSAGIYLFEINTGSQVLYQRVAIR